MVGSCASCPNCPIVQQGDANFPCNFCDQVFCQNIDLKNHVRYGHEDARIFKCMHCHENYVYRSDMEKHILNAHGKCEIYKCECNFCGKVLSTRNLKHHVKSVHEGLKNHKCDICDYRSSQSSDLKKHILKYHDDPLNTESPMKFSYKCEFCPKTLCDKNVLYKHIRNIHDVDPKKLKTLEMIPLAPSLNLQTENNSPAGRESNPGPSNDTFETPYDPIAALERLDPDLVKKPSPKPPPAKDFKVEVSFDNLQIIYYNLAR